MEEFKKIQKETENLQEMLEVGVDEYQRTHANCCDAPLTPDKEHCGECGEGCSNQVGE